MHVHLSEQTVNVLVIAWATGHDAVFFAIYHALTHFRIVKPHRSLDDRVAAIERHLGIKPDDDVQSPREPARQSRGCRVVTEARIDSTRPPIGPGPLVRQMLTFDQIQAAAQASLTPSERDVFLEHILALMHGVVDYRSPEAPC
jgi:hypothetical protein